MARKPNLTHEPRWLTKALRISPTEIVKRIWAQVISLPIDIRALRRLKKQAEQEGKTLYCVVLTDRLGDIIAAEPVARQLVAADRKLVWLVQRRYRDLLVHNPNIDAVQTVNSYTETILLRALFGAIHWTVLHFDGYRCDRFGITARNPVPSTVNVNNYYDFGALTDVFSLIGTNQISGERPKVYADSDFSASDFLATVFEHPENPLLVMQMRSDDEARSWSIPEAKKTISWILDHTNYNVLEVGLSPTIEKASRTYPLGGRLSLSKQIAVIGKAKLFLGVDSGFAHIANSLGIRSVFLLGKFRAFETYTPWRLSEHDLIIRSQASPAQITCEEVTKALSKALSAPSNVALASD